jgi:predicted lactoylglutathione lyase
VASEMRLELIQVPVSDIDLAKDYVEKLGFNADHDHRVSFFKDPDGNGWALQAITHRDQRD